MLTLKVGDKAPDFTSKDQDGNPISLSDFQGKKVLLYFYPKDDTSGCTKQACNLNDNLPALAAQGYTVLGVSIDDEKSHTKFRAKYGLQFPLIADTDKSIVEAYGVWQEKSMYGKKYMGTARVTFLIDEQGIISKIIEKVKTDDHTAQVLA